MISLKRGKKKTGLSNQWKRQNASLFIIKKLLNEGVSMTFTKTMQKFRQRLGYIFFCTMN